MWTVCRNISVAITTQCGLDGPGIEFLIGDRFSASFRMVPGSHTPSFTMITESFPGLEWPERGVIQLPLSSAEVKKKKQSNSSASHLCHHGSL
jgi:hypothetical protein